MTSLLAPIELPHNPTYKYVHVCTHLHTPMNKLCGTSKVLNTMQNKQKEKTKTIRKRGPENKTNPFNKSKTQWKVASSQARHYSAALPIPLTLHHHQAGIFR